MDTHGIAPIRLLDPGALAAASSPDRRRLGSSGIDARAQRIGRMQRGLVLRRQLAAVGVGPAAIRRRLDAELWSEEQAGLVDLGTHAPSWEQGLVRALLVGGPGQAWASHRTAAYLHGLLDAARPSHYEILIPRCRRPVADRTIYHSFRSLDDDEVAQLRGLPVTSVARTLLDLASTMAVSDLEPVIWDAARRHRGLVGSLSDLIGRRPRAAGRKALLAVIAGIHPEVARVESPLEVAGLIALRELGVPWPQVQFPVRDAGGRFVGRADAAWPEGWVIVEFQGLAYHRTPTQRADDRRRRARMESLGWMVIEVRASDLRDGRIREVAAVIRRRLDGR